MNMIRLKDLLLEKNEKGSAVGRKIGKLASADDLELVQQIASNPNSYGFGSSGNTPNPKGTYTYVDPITNRTMQRRYDDKQIIPAATREVDPEKFKSFLKDLEKNTDWLRNVAKDIYYNWWQNGKACEINASSKDAAFLQAKRDGCNFFKWDNTWYNTQTNMPVEQEIKAYGDNLKQQGYKHPVVVDYFIAGQWAVGGGFGHIQTWSLKEPQYQINAMPSSLKSVTDYLTVVVGNDDINTDSMRLYNQAVEELNGYNKESMVILLNDKEYAHYKSVVGEWKGKRKYLLTNFSIELGNVDNSKDLDDARKSGQTGKYYNILTNNCSHHTLQALQPSDSELWNKFVRAVRTIPATAYEKIKSMYKGRTYDKQEGVRFAKIPGVGERVPDKYTDPNYVIKNAETIVSNKWTIVVQQTLWAQYDAIKRNADNKLLSKYNEEVHSLYQKAADAIDKMYQGGYVQNGNKWDKIFGPDTKAALKAVRDLSKYYKPVPIPN